MVTKVIEGIWELFAFVVIYHAVVIPWFIIYNGSLHPALLLEQSTELFMSTLGPYFLEVVKLARCVSFLLYSACGVSSTPS